MQTSFAEISGKKATHGNQNQIFFPSEIYNYLQKSHVMFDKNIY